MDFLLSFGALLIYVAVLAGGWGYHLGQKRAIKVITTVTVDDKLIGAFLEASGYTIMPKGVEWPGEKRKVKDGGV